MARTSHRSRSLTGKGGGSDCVLSKTPFLSLPRRYALGRPCRPNLLGRPWGFPYGLPYGLRKQFEWGEGRNGAWLVVLRALLICAIETPHRATSIIWHFQEPILCPDVTPVSRKSNFPICHFDHPTIVHATFNLRNWHCSILPVVYLTFFSVTPLSESMHRSIVQGENFHFDQATNCQFLVSITRPLDHSKHPVESVQVFFIWDQRFQLVLPILCHDNPSWAGSTQFFISQMQVEPVQSKNFSRQNELSRLNSNLFSRIWVELAQPQFLSKNSSWAPISFKKFELRLNPTGSQLSPKKWQNKTFCWKFSVRTLAYC